MVLCCFLGASSSVKAATFIVQSGGDLQAALNAANCGDEVVLQAGATFIVPGQEAPFLLKNKGPCTGTNPDYITIRTSDLSGLPLAGTRVTPSNGPSMPRLLSNVGTAVLEAEANAHHYKLVGIEFTNAGGDLLTNQLIDIGSRGGDIIPFAQKPHHIIFDRCWIHEATNDTTTPDSAETSSERGFNINGADITISDSRIAGFRGFYKGTTTVVASNAILFPRSAQRVTVSNTYLEAWFVPIFFGGTGAGETPNTATVAASPAPTTSRATLSNVNNLLVGDLLAFKVTGGTYSGGAIPYQVAQVTAINGNTIDYVSQYSSVNGTLQGGTPLTVAPDAPGDARWNGYLPTDITIDRCEIELKFNPTEYVWTHTKSDPSQSAFGDPTTLPLAQQLNLGYGPKGFTEVKIGKRVTFNANIWEGWADGFTFTVRNQTLSPEGGDAPWSTIEDLRFTNNWVRKTPNYMRRNVGFAGLQGEDNELTSKRGKNWLIENNFFENGGYGEFLKMGAVDNLTVRHNTFPGIFPGPGNQSGVFGYGAPSPGMILQDNILPNHEYGVDNCQITVACWPDEAQDHNVIIDDRINRAENLATSYPNDSVAPSQSSVGFIDLSNGNPRLSAASPYRGRASDGKDPGVDMDQLLAALGGAPTPTPTPTATPNTGPAVGTRVTVDVDGVFIRSGPSIIYGVIGTQGPTSFGLVDQPCVNDPASSGVFCHVVFDAAPNGWVTAEHLIELAAFQIRLITLNGDQNGSLLAINIGRETAESPVSITTLENFGADKRTRLMIFAVGVSSNAPNTDPSNDIIDDGVVIPNLAESVVVEAHTQDGRIYKLPVEFAGAQGFVPSLDQVNVVLIPELEGAGTVDLTLIINGQRSNAPTIVVR